MLNQKPLAEMTPDEIAQLSPDKFKGLADSHNDELELRETARDRQIDQAKEWGMSEDNPENYPASLPNPDAEIDQVLNGLLKPRPSPEPQSKPLVSAVVEALKELPEAVRGKMNPFRAMAKTQEGDEGRYREHTLRDERW